MAKFNFRSSLIAVCPRPSGGFVPEAEVMSVLKQRFLWWRPHPVDEDVTNIAGCQSSEVDVGIRAMTLISKSNPASQVTPTAVQFG